MTFENVGKVWTPALLAEHLKGRTKPARIKNTTLHHTAEPSLAQRPNGLTIQHIINIREYYKKPKLVKGVMKPGWKSGPRLFIDEDEIFGMCDFSVKGVHAVSFNSSSLGIDVIGSYDVGAEAPKSGRGLRCWKNAAAGIRVLLDWLGLQKSEHTILFHRDDPETSKTCPGTAVNKDWFLDLIPGFVPDPVQQPAPFAKPDVGIVWDKWHFAGEKWCVPILPFLSAKGVETSDVIARLKSKDGKLYYGNELIEGGIYIAKDREPKPDETSWAPASELLEIITL